MITNIEQSKRLFNSGLCIDSADHCHTDDLAIFPAWSIERLWSIAAKNARFCITDEDDLMDALVAIVENVAKKNKHIDF